LSLPAQAFLIGDDILLSHRYPTAFDVIDSFLVVVEAGPGDIQGFGGLYVANPEDSDIYFNFTDAFTWTAYSFNGHRVPSINTPIFDVNITTNVNGWDDSRLFLDGNDIGFNWAGMSVTEESYFYANLSFDHASGLPIIPEPPSLIPFCASLLIFVRKKTFRKNFLIAPRIH
jgi:hypothetical protein